jgi:hypothetical protein
MLVIHLITNIPNHQEFLLILPDLVIKKLFPLISLKIEIDIHMCICVVTITSKFIV